MAWRIRKKAKVYAGCVADFMAMMAEQSRRTDSRCDECGGDKGMVKVGSVYVWDCPRCDARDFPECYGEVND